MALKAGRVGVAKDQVDEFGNILGGGTPENVYTKTQCDNKFETKTHASNTYETKEDIGGLKFRNNDGTAQYQIPDGEWTDFSSGGGGVPETESALITTSFSEYSQDRCKVRKNGKIVEMDLHLLNVSSVIADSTSIGTIPSGYRPNYEMVGMALLGASGEDCCRFNVQTNGNITLGKSVDTSTVALLKATWILN